MLGMTIYSIYIGQHTLLYDMSNLANKSGCTNWINKEATEIKLQPNNMDRMAYTWVSHGKLLHTVREHKKILSKTKFPLDPKFYSGPLKGMLYLFLSHLTQL
jgi:hypothetical protein